MSFKFSNTELWDISSHRKVTTMDSDDRLCSNCKKLFEDEINQTKQEFKQEIKEPENVIKTSNFTKSLNFCPKCGQEVIENASFCVGCGLDIGNIKTLSELKKSYQNDVLPKQVVITKYQSISNKFSILMGIVVILLSTYTFNSYNFVLGIALLIIGFVSLKNKSKTVEQLLTIISLILAGVFTINLLKLF